MHLQPPATMSPGIDARQVQELWQGNQHVCTITALERGLHIVFEKDWTLAPDGLAIEPQYPAGIVITIAEESDEQPRRLVNHGRRRRR